MFQRLRFLAEGEDAGAKAGAGGTSTTDAGAGEGGEKKDAGGEAKKDGGEKGKDEPPARKSVLAAKGDEGGKDGKGDAGAKGAEAKAKDGATDDYVVKLPEGEKADPARLETFTKAAKDAGITAEQASKLASFQLAQEKAQADAWAKQDQDWYGELEKDSEFGGANLKASEVALQTALKRFDPDGSLAKDLAKYGVENLPSLAKFLARVGKAGGEDKAGLEKAPKDALKKLSSAERRQIFYDDMKPEKAEK